MDDIVFNTEFWAELEENDCPCSGIGWANFDDIWEECPIHFTGQLHPLSRDLLMDEPRKLKEEERKSHLKWKIRESQKKIKDLQSSLKREQNNVSKWEVELINNTKTRNMMPAVIDPLLLEMK
jgi:hypothetical protein